jgi:hypothetical protein
VTQYDDRRDNVFLLLWTLSVLAATTALLLYLGVRVRTIELAFRESRHTDQHGNVFRYRAPLKVDGVTRRAWAIDVYPVVDVDQSAGPAVCAVPLATR